MGYRMINHYCDRLIEKNESISQNTNEKDFYIEYNGVDGKVLIYEFFNLQDKTNWYIWMFFFFLLGLVLGLSIYNKSFYDQKGKETK